MYGQLIVNIDIRLVKSIVVGQNIISYRNNNKITVNVGGRRK